MATFNIHELTDLPLRQIARTLRDEGGNTDTRSLAALFRDPTLDRQPTELWVGTVAEFGYDILSAEPRQTSNLFPRYEGHVHRAGNIVITVQQSADEIRRIQRDAIRDARREAARARWDVSDGTSATSAPKALVE